MPFQIEEIRERAGTLTDGQAIADMLIPITRMRYTSLDGSNALVDNPGPTYTCKHHQTNGDCGIYQDRPSMCRNFPYGRPCESASCEMKEDEQCVVLAEMK